MTESKFSIKLLNNLTDKIISHIINRNEADIALDVLVEYIKDSNSNNELENQNIDQKFANNFLDMFKQSGHINLHKSINHSLNYALMNVN